MPRPRDGKLPPNLLPICLSAHEECRLLLAVELLNAVVFKKDSSVYLRLLCARATASTTITLRGQPFQRSLSYGGYAEARVASVKGGLWFPPHPFPSRWNCVPDLVLERSPTPSLTDREMLSEHPSPFPFTTLSISASILDKGVESNLFFSRVASNRRGSKRFTTPSGPVPRSPLPILTCALLDRRPTCHFLALTLSVARAYSNKHPSLCAVPNAC